MKKRILAVLLVLALVVVAGAFAVSATGGTETEATPAVDETIAAAYICPCHLTPIDEITDWVEFKDGVTMEDNKHYRMLADVTLTDASPLTSNYYAISAGEMLLDTNGFLLNAKNASNRVFGISSGVVLTIVDTSEAQTGMVRGGANGGGAITVNGTLNLLSSHLGNRRNTAASTPQNGGVVLINGGGVFNMYGGELVPANGTLTGQIAQKGGAVYISSNGIYNLYGGVVNSVKVNTDKNATNGGDAIYIGSSTARFNMYGGTVNGLGYGKSPAGTSVRGAICQNGDYNSAHIKGGTINGSVYLLNNYHTIKISGNPVIECVDAGRMTDAARGGIVLGEDGVTGGRIGVLPKTATSNTFISNVNTVDVTSSAPYFYSPTFRANVAETADGRLELVANNVCPHCPGGVAEWVAYTNQTNSGHYYLTADKTVSDQLKIGADNDATKNDIVLDLYGNTFTNSNSRFSVRAGVKFSLMDSVGGGELIGNNTDDGGVINLHANSEFTLHSGHVKEGQVESSRFYGGAIDFAGTGAKVYIMGGKVTGNYATCGAAIGVHNGGELYISGGEIIGGNATNGGAIAVNEKTGSTTESKLYITGGKITARTATHGDALYVKNSAINFDKDYDTDYLSGDIYFEETVTTEGLDGVRYGLTEGDGNWDYIWYKDIDAAVKGRGAHDDKNVYIKLFTDVTYTLPEDGTYNVDINGKTVEISDNALCFDSANDGFNADACGSVTMNAPATYVNAPNGNLYITVKNEDGTYSFHRLQMQFERLSLRPSVAGVYYSSSWNGDEVLFGNVNDVNNADFAPVITGYGMALKKDSAPTNESFDNGEKFAYTYFDNAEGITSNFLAGKKGKEINSCLLSNIINATNDVDTNVYNATEVTIYAAPYVVINNSEYVVGSEEGVNQYGNTLKGIVEWVVSEIVKMTGDEKTNNINKITPLYENFCETGKLGVVDFFAGLKDLVDPEVPADSIPDETTAPTVAG